MAGNNTNSQNPLDPSIPANVKYGGTNDGVLGAIDTVQKSWSEKNLRDTKNLAIHSLLEQGFSVQDPTGTRKLDGYVLQQALWRMANRMKPLDFQIHASGRSEANEKIVTNAIAQVMEDGGYLRALRDKGGGFNFSLLFGDAFIMVGTSDNPNIPIAFMPLANSNVYVDNYATTMRSGGPGRNVDKMVVVQSMSYAQVLEKYPEAKGKAGAGSIPRDLNFMKETGRSFLQTQETQADYTEVAHYYDISNKVYVRFVGSACTVLEDLRGKKYPFVKDGKPYIPVIHRMCWPAIEGFWNHGIGDMLYKLVIMTRRFLNMAVGHAEDNVYPITLVNVPNQEVSKFFNKLLAAHEMRAQGKKGYVAMEYDPSNPATSRVTAEQLQTPAALSEWAEIYNRLDTEIQRLGINLNEASYGPNTTATQILSEEESQNAFIKQIGEYNATEEKFAVELTLDFIKKFVKKSNDTVVNMPTKVKVDGEDIKMDSITLGAVADELRKFDYFVKINARTGAVPSNTAQQAQISRLLPLAQPGTKAFGTLAVELAQLNDRDIAMEDFMPPSPTGSPQEIGDKPIPTETDRLVMNSKLKEAQPVF